MTSIDQSEDRLLTELMEPDDSKMLRPLALLMDDGSSVLVLLSVLRIVGDGLVEGVC